MKRSIIALTLAGAMLAVASPALAQDGCPNNSKKFDYVQDHFGIPGGYSTATDNIFDVAAFDNVDDCWTPKSKGTLGAVTGIIEGTEGPDEDGDYVGVKAAVYGPNGTAIGNSSFVGKVIPAVPASCSVGAVNEAGDGCVEDGADFTPEIPEAIAPVDGGTALGANSTVGHNHSTAVGADSATDRDNQVVLGTENDEVTVRNLTKNTAAKDETVGIVVHEADGTLASDGGRIQGEIDANTAGVAANADGVATNAATLVSHGETLASHGEQIDINTDGIARLGEGVREAKEGAAMALAMDVPDLDKGKTFGISLSWGNFDGENALAGAANLRIDETWSANAGIGYGFSQNTVGGRAGLRAQW